MYMTWIRLKGLVNSDPGASCDGKEKTKWTMLQAGQYKYQRRSNTLTLQHAHSNLRNSAFSQTLSFPDSFSTLSHDAFRTCSHQCRGRPRRWPDTEHSYTSWIYCLSRFSQRYLRLKGYGQQGVRPRQAMRYRCRYRQRQRGLHP